MSQSTPLIAVDTPHKKAKCQLILHYQITTTMKTTPKDSRLFSIIVLYDMHSDFLHKALDGISDDDAHNRLGTKANHVAWIAGSLVEQRFELANMLGLQTQHAAHELFKSNQGIKDDVKYPSLKEYQSEWDRITPQLKDLLLNAESQKLDEKFEMSPDFKITYFELISFMTYREANCIGQIALYRRLLGYEAMKYM